MSSLRAPWELPRSVLRTWGPRGVGRRAVYEAARRSRRLSRAETSWLAGTPTTGPPRTAGVVVPGEVAAGSGRAEPTLYGALPIVIDGSPDWHRHPLTGQVFDATAHWSTLSDASPAEGDIKDVWELSRLGWLIPRVRDGVRRRDDGADVAWRVVEDWARANPPYRGPNWMCGQEASLRAITALFLADALRADPATTPERLDMVTRLVDHSVGRVVPTLGYALSQRNNHAISEAGFLWTASILLPGLPDATRLRRRAARALTEAVNDQFAPDGSYAQHSPTYQRLALHVLLWCLCVARAQGCAPPPGAVDAVERSVTFLRGLVAPGSAGRVPNLGGNDGALLFDLVPTDITDFRPVIAHAAAATGQPSGFGPGPWDEEAAWFGLRPVTTAAPSAASPATATHALTRGQSHAVLRAGPLRHRPAHADQLHVDVWIGGQPVAVDAGSYRYTAMPPWSNALAGDDVHNVPHRPTEPQAVRAGRFFWRRWAEAELERSLDTPEGASAVARLRLIDATSLRRLLVVGTDLVVVVDECPADGRVRWNLLDVTGIDRNDDETTVTGAGWSSVHRHGLGAVVTEGSETDPASGWHAPTYGVREPLTALLLPPTVQGRVASVFGQGDPDGLRAACDAALSLDLDRIDGRVIDHVRATS